jgi:hypothetical protein
MLPRSVRSVLFAVSLAAVFLAPRVATADDETEVNAAPAPLKRPGKQWYGYQTLAVDGGALSLAFFGLVYDSPWVTRVGVGTYALGPPLVHAAHERAGAAFASLGIRVVAPPAGMLAGFGLGWVVGGGLSDGNGWAALLVGAGGAILGGTAGYVGAVALDAGALAYESAPSPAEASRDARKVRVHVQPTLAIARQGTSVGLAGTF